MTIRLGQPPTLGNASRDFYWSPGEIYALVADTDVAWKALVSSVGSPTPGWLQAEYSRWRQWHDDFGWWDSMWGSTVDQVNQYRNLYAAAFLRAEQEGFDLSAAPRPDSVPAMRPEAAEAGADILSIVKWTAISVGAIAVLYVGAGAYGAYRRIR